MNINDLHDEINNILAEVGRFEDGPHLWESYQKVAAYLVRLTQIHTDLAWEEINGLASPQNKKFRTMVVDPTIETLTKIASYESRKLTARKMELEIDR